MESTGCRNSVLMFPWLAHGHISPFLELAKKLSNRNFNIYFCSTPINMSSIKERLSEEESLSIQLVELQLPSSPELPAHYHTTNGLPPHLMATLKCVLYMAKPSFSSILQTLKPDFLIYDFVNDWAAPLASSCNIPSFQMNTTGMAATSFTFHQLKYPGDTFPLPSIYYHEHEKVKLRNLFQESSRKEFDEEQKLLEAINRSSDMLLVRTYRDIEAKYIDHTAATYNRKIVPIGSLVQEPVNEDDHTGVIEWLDKKEKSSTVYVSFGSEYFLSKEEMEEIAQGLDLSNLNFIWVIRFPKEQEIKIEEALPEGFLEKTRGRGMVMDGWAPQTRILKHSSIGGFVSHCGWSSVMEGLKYCVPIIAMPMSLDQPVNARLVEELGMGMEVKRDREGRLERYVIANVIKVVVVEEAGECVRRRVSELNEVISSKEEEQIDGLVSEMLKLYNEHRL